MLTNRKTQKSRFFKNPMYPDPYTIDLRYADAQEYTNSRDYGIGDTILKFGVFFFALLGIGYVISQCIPIADADEDIANLGFVIHFPEDTQVIGCYNDRTKKPRAGKVCNRPGDHNIMLPPREHIYKWLNHFNQSEIVNRLALVNFESSFIEENGNAHAYGYVQTLRRWNVPPDIDSQFTWLKNRQFYQKKKFTPAGSRRCGYYWENANTTDGYEAGEYGVLACLYRYHYHSEKGTWYAQRGIETTKFYKWYMFGIGNPSDYQ